MPPLPEQLLRCVSLLLHCYIVLGLCIFALHVSEKSGHYKWKLVRKAVAPAFSTANLRCASAASSLLPGSGQPL